MDNLPKVDLVPAALADAFAKVNAAIDELNAIRRSRGTNGINIIKAEGNWVFDFDPTNNGSDGGGGSLPAGYTFEEFTICDSGTPATRFWPTWTSDPS